MYYNQGTKGMITLCLEESSNVFELLALLGTMIIREEENECAQNWAVASEAVITNFLKKYKNFLAIILNSSANEYKFTDKEVDYLNRELDKLKGKKDDIYFLLLQTEQRIDMYANWQCRGMIYELGPLNGNAEETGIAVYPHGVPEWDVSKSERQREFSLNANFQNYILIRREDERPFQFVMHYWNDSRLLRKNGERDWELRVALAPVMNDADLDAQDCCGEIADGVSVNGVKNPQAVTKRVLEIFDVLFAEGFGVIIYPEALGNDDIVNGIKQRMRMHPEICTMVLLPTICGNKRNVLVVLGPGGIEILREEKAIPFIHEDIEGHCRRESFEYSNKIHILITGELGNIVFPICAEILEPRYYSRVSNIAYVDTMLCPSFSPGVNAFYETFLKGIAPRLLTIWTNSCSAKAVSRKGTVSDTVGIIQLPTGNVSESMHECRRECADKCSRKVCYFDVCIRYRNNMFTVEKRHRCA